MGDLIHVVPYDSRWPRLYEQERGALEAALGRSGLAFEHVGSTAVPGLMAKPTLDIMIGAPDARVDAAAVAAIGSLGYGHLGEHGVPGREFFRKGLPPTHHVHWTRRGAAFWSDQLLFRDFLRRHPAECEAYEKLKVELAERFRHDRPGYTASKAALIGELLEKARLAEGARKIVVDLEATCWERGTALERQEIIEIGAVELDARTLEPTREFERLVKPAREPVLSDFCRQLTHIAQAEVDAAPPFERALEGFAAWIGPGPFELCSWGRYDLEQFRVECARRGRPLPGGFERHVDLRALFARREGLPPGTMVAALERRGLALEGAQHRGLADARNVARLAKLLLG